MAIEVMDGWEGGDLTLWPVTNGSPTVIAARTGHSGSYCLHLDASGRYVRRDITAAAEYWFAGRFEMANSTQTHALVTFYKGTTVILQLRCNATSGYLSAYAGTTLLATASTQSLTVGTVYHIEGYIKIADAPDGRFTAYVNDPGRATPVIAFEGDTLLTADTTVDKVHIGYENTGREAGFYVDDFVLDNADYPGNLRIQAIVPSANTGSSAQWDPSTGENWECINEKPASDADYISTNVSDEVDMHTAGNLTGSIVSIKAIQPNTSLCF